MDSYVISGILTTVTSFTLGVFVYLKKSKDALNIIWFLLSLSTAIWSFGVVKSITAPNEALGLFWGRFNHVGVILIPVFFWNFLSIGSE